MTASLDCCWAKLDRAKEQIDALNDELGEYVESQPYRITDKPERWPGDRFVFRYIDVQPAPLRFGVIFGEIVHDLRSALDHLVYQLVKLNRKRPYFGSSFPVFDNCLPDPNAPKRKNWKANAPRQLKGVRSSHRAFIEAVQPYQRRHRAMHHPLRVLTDLWNIDKHRILHAVALSSPSDRVPMDLSVDLGGYAGVDAEVFVQPGPLKDGAPALSIRFSRLSYGTPHHIHVQGYFPINVKFGDDLIPTVRLHRIGGFIASRVLNEAADLFPDEQRRDHPLMHELTPRWDFPRVRLGEGHVVVLEPSKSPARFREWEVWFEGPHVALGSDGILRQELPSWQIRSPDQELFVIPARDTTREQLGLALSGLFEPDQVAEFFEYFEPEPRDYSGVMLLVPK